MLFKNKFTKILSVFFCLIKSCYTKAIFGAHVEIANYTLIIQLAYVA